MFVISLVRRVSYSRFSKRLDNLECPPYVPKKPARSVEVKVRRPKTCPSFEHTPRSNPSSFMRRSMKDFHQNLDYRLNYKLVSPTSRRVIIPRAKHDHDGCHRYTKSEWVKNLRYLEVRRKARPKPAYT